MLSRVARLLPAVVLLAGCADGGAAAPSPSAAAGLDPERAQLLSALPAEGLDRGVWLLTPGSPDYPGSPLDALLPTERAELLVEAPGPVALLTGVDSGVRVTEPARRVGDVVVLAAPGEVEQVAERLGGTGSPEGLLARLAGSGAATAWAGRTAVGSTVVTLSGGRLQVEIEAAPDELADAVRTAVAEKGLPGSPGRRWSQLLVGARVQEQDGRLVLTARTTDALPPPLLRQLVESGALPPR